MSSEDLESKLCEAELRAEECRANMMKAAEFGKDLLERNVDLETEIGELKTKLCGLEDDQQEKHVLTLKCQSLSQSLSCLQLECESLKTEMASKTESLTLNNKDLKNALRENEIKLGEKELKENQLNERITLLLQENNLLKTELSEKCSVSSPVQSHNMSLNESYNNELFLKAEIYREEKNALEREVLSLKEEMSGISQELTEKRRENCQLTETLEEKEAEMMNYVQSLQSVRAEAHEMNDEMDAIKSLDHRSKGNSLFSEVEDRRALVENKLESLQIRNAEMKRLLDEKTQQINRIKLQNVALLNLAAQGGTAATNSKSHQQVSRLLEELNHERKLNKTLSDQLEAMKISTDMKFDTTSSSSNDSTLMEVKHTSSSEYGYLASMLTEKSKQITDLKERLRSQMRSTLEECDLSREMRRKLEGSESLASRLRAENYRLKLQIEENKSKDEIKPTAKPQKNKTIFEDIKFKEPPKKKEDSGNILDLTNNNNKENTPNNDDTKKNIKKKSVKMAETVQVMNEDEKIKLKCEEDSNRKVQKEKKEFRKPKTHEITSVDEEDEKLKNECATQ